MSFFIAEVSSNHSRDIDRAIKFIDTAAEIGCDAVKFQLFKIDKIFAAEILERSENVFLINAVQPSKKIIYFTLY